uniref:Myelin basic protein n=1 Tax=Sus scrofa TaxID=9823 RepID=A0A287AYH7_PIG
MASQKRPSQRHGSKYLASANTGILDSLGRFFGADRGAPKRGSGKDGHHAARTTHYGSLPQKAQHGRPQDENPVVHFFKNIVSVPFPRCLAGRGRCPLFLQGAEGQKPGFGYGGRAPDYKPAHKGLKGAQDAQGTLSKIFKLGPHHPQPELEWKREGKVLDSEWGRWLLTPSPPRRAQRGQQ